MKPEDAFKKVANLCSRQEKCRSDVTGKLRDWGIANMDIESIIRRLEQEKYIDESRYAKAFAKDKFRQNKWGKIKINYMLKQKHIPEQIIEMALANIDEEEYLELLEKDLTRKLNSIHSGKPVEKKGKLLNYASSKGFEKEFVFPLLNKLIR